MIDRYAFSITGENIDDSVNEARQMGNQLETNKLESTAHTKINLRCIKN